MNTSSELLTLASFSDVDADPDAATLVAALDEQATMPAVHRLRAVATELLNLRPGDRIVDVGCGTGDTTRALARIVGPQGAVIGLDPSDTMLAEGRRRTVDQSLSVQFRSGDIARLELDDGACDGAHCERVLQHVEAADLAIGELVRVTRPGGRIVVIDTDWGMHAIHGADPRLTALVVDAWAANAANGWSGRRLPALFADAGMPNPVVVAETFTSTDPDRPTRPPFTTMAATTPPGGRAQRRRGSPLARPAHRRRPAGPVLLGGDDVRRRRTRP